VQSAVKKLSQHQNSKNPTPKQNFSRNSLQKTKNPRLNLKNPQNPVFHPVILHQKPLFFSISRKKAENRRKK